MPSKQSLPPQLSLVAVYHIDVPVQASSSHYSPSPLSMLSYLATTIMTMHSLSQVLTEQVARERSLPVPAFGLDEEIEGIVIASRLQSQPLKHNERGIVIELEHRRKSGRGVVEWYFLPTPKAQSSAAQAFKETITLLDDHPSFKEMQDEPATSEELEGLTFELGLTEKQRQDRDGVVLPYLDAQKIGGGGGGRILYDMGVEDDFDDEEDEI